MNKIQTGYIAVKVHCATNKSGESTQVMILRESKWRWQVTRCEVVK